MYFFTKIAFLVKIGEIPPLGHVPKQMYGWLIRRERHGDPKNAMKVEIIDSKSLPIIEYNHIHDSKILFRKYRENFNFGLTVNQYYFDKEK